MFILTKSPGQWSCSAIITSSIVLLFMHRRHFIGQDVLVSAILDSKVHRRRAYQPAEQHSPKRGRDIAIGGEDGSAPWIGVGARNRSPRNLDPRSMRETYPTLYRKKLRRNRRREGAIKAFRRCEESRRFRTRFILPSHTAAIHRFIPSIKYRSTNVISRILISTDRSRTNGIQFPHAKTDDRLSAFSSAFRNLSSCTDNTTESIIVKYIKRT